ncbi:hypothetical protein BKA70DRAFT_723618 [Coprinopsis sp. MPI-PUGE-AT-0042]|nr:hypothetical protein BKA70DRAFT_723618 [Coprinopsis sp. MPI-PUGE-AT-0042]
MPILAPYDKVLVTGANGFLGLWITRTLLERGYSVRAAVRSESKGSAVLDLFKDYEGKVEIAIVEDMSKEGAWNEAVKGVQGVVHTATPLDFSQPDAQPEVFIEPAVKGTRGILQSALKDQASQIKRIVVTSSLSAATDLPAEPRVYTEKDWNNDAISAVEESGGKAGLLAIYSASKALAEKEAWKFYEEHKAEVKWELGVIVPPMMFGPPLGPASSPSALNISLQFFWNNVVSSETPKTAEALSAHGVWADVRDLAEAHVRSLEVEKASGERIFVASGPFIWQDWVDAAYNLKPSALPNHTLSAGAPDVDRKRLPSLSTEKEQAIFGLKYRTREETAKDMLEEFAKRGW